MDARAMYTESEHSYFTLTITFQTAGYFGDSLCFLLECIPACFSGTCNTTMGTCECSDGYTGLDCSGRYIFTYICTIQVRYNNLTSSQEG